MTTPCHPTPSVSFTVAAGQVWRHYKGWRYRVLGLVLDEHALTWRVHYASADGKGPPWSRPLAEWVGMASLYGEIVPRYALEEEK